MGFENTVTEDLLLLCVHILDQLLRIYLQRKGGGGRVYVPMRPKVVTLFLQKTH